MRDNPWKPLEWLSGVVIVVSLAVLWMAPDLVRHMYGRHGFKTAMGPLFGVTIMVMMLAMLVGLYAMNRRFDREFPHRKERTRDVSDPDPEAIRLLVEGMLRSARRGTLAVTEADVEQEWGEPERAAAFATAVAALDQLTPDQLGLVKLGNELAVRLGRRRLFKTESYLGMVLLGIALSQIPSVVLPFPVGMLTTVALILVTSIAFHYAGKSMTATRTPRKPEHADHFLADCLEQPRDYLDALAAMEAVERGQFPLCGPDRSAREYARRRKRLEEWLNSRSTAPLTTRSGEASRPTAPSS